MMPKANVWPNSCDALVQEFLTSTYLPSSVIGELQADHRIQDTTF